MQKKTQSLPKHIRSGFAPATIKSSPIVQLQRPDSPPTPKKKVNFAARDQLTRGKDKSYSPPPGPRKVRFSPEFISDDTSSEDEDTTKQVRFSEKLIRGEGTGYNNLAPKASERYPYASRAFQPSRLRRNVSPSALKEPRSKLKRPASPIRTPSPPSPINTMRRSNFYKKYPLPYGQFNESDIDNDDSDDSFSDIVAEEAAAVEMKRHQPPLKNPLNPLKAPPDRRPESTRQPARPTRAHGILQSVADTEDSYVADVTSANTRRNSVSGQPTAGGVPTHNRQGHRIRASYDANAFDGRRQPVFVLRSTSGNSAPARPQPVFVSRGSGGAHRRSSSDTTSNVSRFSSHPILHPFTSCEKLFHLYTSERYLVASTNFQWEALSCFRSCIPKLYLSSLEYSFDLHSKVMCSVSAFLSRSGFPNFLVNISASCLGYYHLIALSQHLWSLNIPQELELTCFSITAIPKARISPGVSDFTSFHYSIQKMLSLLNLMWQATLSNVTECIIS